MSISVVTFRILVKPDDVLEKKYKTEIKGFVIAGMEKEREQQAVDVGTVVNIGPTAFKDYDVENPLSVGDKVVYAKFAGKEVVDPETDEKFLVINDEDVVAILRGSKES